MIDPPASRHPQMKDHRVPAIGVDQPIFGAAAEPRDRGAGQPLTEILGKGMAQVGAAHLEPSDPTSLEHALEAADGGFDFGELGHGRDMAKGWQPR